jgi:hypothetical protein
MKIFSHRTIRAFTLVEMITSVGCGMIILGAILAAGISLQKSYAAVESYSMAEADQLRVLDYIAMDCRRATNAAVTTVTVNGVTENALVLTLPTYYSSSTSSSATFNTPSVTSGSLVFGSVSGGSVTANTDIVTVTYEQNVSNFTREVKVCTDSTCATVKSDNTTPIAKNVSTFTVNPVDLTKSVSCSIMFFPAFLHNTGTGTWRSGQYTPNDQTPDNGLGSNGDWYVINNTAADSTTVGDVYYKSGGSYSKIQNVKATTVSVQAFLRNAVARQ